MNRINPAKLLLSKWTAAHPRHKEKHFLVTELFRDDEGTVLDIEEDRIAGKVTLAVLLGKQKTSHLYYALLYIGITLLTLTGIYQQKIGLIVLPMLIAIPVYQHLKTIKNYANQQIPPSELAKQLKKIVLITLVSSVIYSLNQLFK